MLDTELRRKLAWLIALRAIVVTILMGSATLIEITAPGSFPIGQLYFLIGLTYALTIFYAGTLRFAERSRALVDLQLAGDALIVSAFIYLTGGVTSYFSLLYLLPIVAGSTVQLRRGGLLVAALSTSLYVVVVLMQYNAGGRPIFSNGAALTLPALLVAEYTVAVNVFCFFAVARLSGSLAAELHTASAGLVQASTELADLQALNQHVINSLPSGLITTDRQQRILTFNRAAEAITGVEWAAAAGRPVGEVLQLPQAVVAALDDTTNGDWRTRRYELNYHTADRRDIELGMTITHLETPGGRAGFLV